MTAHQRLLAIASNGATSAITSANAIAVKAMAL